MRIIICGAGKVGLTIAKQLLLNAENEVTIIDYDAERINNAKNLDLKTIYGFSSAPEVLDRAGATYTDVIICVTLSDEINMLTAHIAGTMFNIKTKIARIRSGMYLSDKWLSHIYNQNVLGIDRIVSPEVEVANHVLDMLHNVGIEDRVAFYRQNYELISLAINENSYGKTAKQLANILHEQDMEECYLAFIKRAKDIHFNLNITLQKGDEAYVLCRSKDVSHVVRCFREGITTALRNILICGGGEIAFHTAKALQEYFKVKLIDDNAERCQFLTDNLSSTVVIHGNMHDRDLILECGQVDAIVSLSGRDDANLFTTLIAKSLDIRECFTLIDQTHYSDVFSLVNLRNIINTRDITISRIISCISGECFISQKAICDGYYSICEFIVHKDSELNGMEYHKLESLKMNILAVVQHEEIVPITQGNSKFASGDAVLAIIPFKNIKKLESLIEHD